MTGNKYNFSTKTQIQCDDLIQCDDVKGIVLLILIRDLGLHHNYKKRNVDRPKAQDLLFGSDNHLLSDHSLSNHLLSKAIKKTTNTSGKQQSNLVGNLEVIIEKRKIEKTT